MPATSDGLFAKFTEERARAVQTADHGLMDRIQRDLLLDIQGRTGRKLAGYFANPTNEWSQLNQTDKGFFVSLLDGVDRAAEELDVIVYSPGGYPETLESVVRMMRRRFSDVRFIVPHFAKSAATMLVLSGNALVMKDTAELGPIDPQVRSRLMSGPAQAILDGWDELRQQIDSEGKLNPAYLPILEKLDIALLKACRSANKYGESMVRAWLREYMFSGDAQAGKKAQKAVKYFGSHKRHLTHGRPLFRDEIVEKTGIPVVALESLGEEIAAKIWEYHYRFEFLFLNNPALAKIYHSEGAYMIFSQGQVILQQGP
jgi:hypothetical protein